jgi:hypothetical protein
MRRFAKAIVIGLLIVVAGCATPSVPATSTRAVTTATATRQATAVATTVTATATPAPPPPATTAKATVAATPPTSTPAAKTVTATATRAPSATAAVAVVPATLSVPPLSKYTCPSDYPIKGYITGTARVYLLPGAASYGATDPVECFASEEDAQAAGYSKAAS